MDRLIKMSDAIEAVWKPQVKPNELIFDALKQAIESEIRNCPTAEASAWILCSERLPSENGTYLATYEWVGLSGTNYTEIDFIDYERGRWQRNFGTVIAWMELPKPYEPQEANE